MLNRLYISFALILLVLTGGQASGAERIYRVAIVQHQKFLPFDQARAGFVDTLTLLGYDQKRIIVDDFNALSDIAALDNKIQQLRQSKDLDLIFSIGTHATKRLVQSVETTPFIFTIVADPMNAGIVKDWQSSGRNYTGVETPNYYSKVVRLMHTFVPFKKLGMIYLQGSPSHEAGLSQITELSKKLDFRFVHEGFPLRNAMGKPFPKDQVREKMEKALETVCPQVDAFFVQTSNTYTDEFDLFRKAFRKYSLVSAGDPTNIQKGLVMGIGKDANRFGRQCAQYAVKILEGVHPRTLPMDVGAKLNIDLNLKAAEQIGYIPPFELVSAADNLYHDVDINE